MLRGFDPSGQGNWRGPNGDFELRGVRPGSYILHADYFDPPDQRFSGRLAVEVGGKDLDGLVVTLVPGLELQGAVRVDGPGELRFEDLAINLEPSTMFTGYTSARVKDDGSFTTRPSRDVYTLRVSGAPPEFFLKALRFGDTDALEHGVDLTQAGTGSSVDVVLRAGAATLEGSVTDEKGKPVRGATLLLRPNKVKPSILAQLQKTVTSDQNGQYKIQGITPGEYYLLAFDGIDTMEAQDPDLFQQYEGSAVKVELPENAKENRALKAISLKDGIE
jgi:hypothetical protein